MNFKLKWARAIKNSIVFRGFNLKPGYWVAKGSDGYIYAGSGWECAGLMYSYRLHRFGRPEPMGWL
jgi:hypothetical protein